jgi:hypothetical protein
MEEIKIRPSQPACARCARAFASGETIVSTIREEAEQFVRSDFCAGCRPEEPVFCFFQTRAPVHEVSARTILEEVREFFRKLETTADRTHHQRRLMYLSALWLSRKKQLKLVETRRVDGRGVLKLLKAWDGEALDLPEELIPEEELPALLDELGRLFHLEASKIELNPAPESV